MQTKIFALTCLALLMAACRAGFETGDASSSDPDNDDEVSLAQLQNDIFTPRCAGCHTGANAPGNGLLLDSVSNTFNSTVNIASAVSGIRRVTPNNANNSYLVQKVEGSANAGSRMPLNSTPLSASEIDNIRRWIDNGASQSRVSSEPTQIISKSDAVIDNTYRIELVFGREIDAAVVQPSNLIMDIQYADYVLTVSPSRVVVEGKRLSAWLELEGEALKITTLFNHATASPILDMMGRPVDGDGDRKEGGPFIFRSAESLSIKPTGDE